jgi:hypothetical protein
VMSALNAACCVPTSCCDEGYCWFKAKARMQGKVAAPRGC